MLVVMIFDIFDENHSFLIKILISSTIHKVYSVSNSFPVNDFNGFTSTYALFFRFFSLTLFLYVADYR